MEQIQTSLARLFLFSFFVVVILLVTLKYASAISANWQKKLLVKNTPIPRAVITPTPTATPTPSPLPTLTPTPTIIPTPLPTADPGSKTVWIQLAGCESHQNWTDDTGNGYYGGLQFSQGAWESVGGVGKPSDASEDEQIKRGEMLQQVRGWSVWGVCSRELGLY